MRFVPLLLIICLLLASCATEQSCCKQCVEAFRQSPVGVGPQGASCGFFTTSDPISHYCISHFESHPKTVDSCQQILEP